MQTSSFSAVNLWLGAEALLALITPPLKQAGLVSYLLSLGVKVWDVPQFKLQLLFLKT